MSLPESAPLQAGAPVAAQTQANHVPAAVAGSLIVVTAPSGAGKTSLVRALLQQRPAIELSISFTTRPPRADERDGVHYHFIDRAEFDRRRAAGEFLEWAEVHGNLYGTSRQWLEHRMAQGHDVVLEIDFQGAHQVAALYPTAITVFIAPPSLEALRERLQGRGQDSADVIERRMQAADHELRQAERFQYVIINQDFAVAVRQLISVVEVAGLRFGTQRARNPGLFARLLGSV